MSKDYDSKATTKELKINAKAVGIPAGAAEVFTSQTIAAVEKSLKNKRIITEADLNRLIAKEVRKYNQDLAYVYKIRDKII